MKRKGVRNRRRYKNICGRCDVGVDDKVERTTSKKVWNGRQILKSTAT